MSALMLRRVESPIRSHALALIGTGRFARAASMTLKEASGAVARKLGIAYEAFPPAATTEGMTLEQKLEQHFKRTADHYLFSISDNDVSNRRTSIFGTVGLAFFCAGLYGLFNVRPILLPYLAIGTVFLLSTVKEHLSLSTRTLNAQRSLFEFAENADPDRFAKMLVERAVERKPGKPWEVQTEPIRRLVDGFDRIWPDSSASHNNCALHAALALALEQRPETGK